MKTIVSYSEVVDGLSNTKLQFNTRHFICSRNKCRCSEFIIDIPTDLAQIIKLWTLFLASFVLVIAFTKEMTMLFVYIYSTIVIIVLMNQFFSVTRESLLVEMEMIGIQQTTVYWSGWKTTEILNREDIVDVIINEAVTMGQVIFYLTVIMKDNSLKPLFIHSKPRLRCLQKLYKEMQDILEKHHKKFNLLHETYFSDKIKL